MDFEEFEGGVYVKGAEKFSLEDTLDCGQCFRWEKIGDKFYGTAYKKEACVYFRGDDLAIEGASVEEAETLWCDYFDLRVSYENIKKELADKSEVLSEAIEYCPGIRILRQDPWETLCSFIISQNNNIPRIKGIVGRFCEKFGEKLSRGYAFPDARTTARLNEEDLEYIRSGFRAKYIIDAARKVSSGEVDMEALRRAPIQAARDDLTKIKGVGPKVAECTLLYGLGRLEAFPEDVWMKKIMKTFFPGSSGEAFGRYAGVAQQYLFHYVRMNPQKLIVE